MMVRIHKHRIAGNEQKRWSDCHIVEGTQKTNKSSPANLTVAGFKKYGRHPRPNGRRPKRRKY